MLIDVCNALLQLIGQCDEHYLISLNFSLAPGRSQGNSSGCELPLDV